jgi:exonuclease III
LFEYAGEMLRIFKTQLYNRCIFITKLHYAINLAFISALFAQDKIMSFKLYSTVLKEDRFFNIYIPSSSRSKFEVIYVLDGQAQFNNVVNALKQLNQNEKIVVGIGNIWLRDRDYTPTHVNSTLIRRRSTFKNK